MASDAVRSLGNSRVEIQVPLSATSKSLGTVRTSPAQEAPTLRAPPDCCSSLLHQSFSSMPARRSPGAEETFSGTSIPAKYFWGDLRWHGARLSRSGSKNYGNLSRYQTVLWLSVAGWCPEGRTCILCLQPVWLHFLELVLYFQREKPRIAQCEYC